jgi:hypothetical protein
MFQQIRIRSVEERRWFRLKENIYRRASLMPGMRVCLQSVVSKLSQEEKR